VRVGDFNTDTTDEPFPFVEVGIARIIVHPEFNPLSLQNDIAVVKLDPSCRLKERNPNINAVCLPEKDVSFTGRR